MHEICSSNITVSLSPQCASVIHEVHSIIRYVVRSYVMLSEQCNICYKFEGWSEVSNVSFRTQLLIDIKLVYGGGGAGYSE